MSSKTKNVETLEREIEFLKKRIAGTNNSVEKATYESRVKDLRKEIESLNSKLGEKKISTQIDVPSVSERVENNSTMLTRGQVMDAGGSVSLGL